MVLTAHALAQFIAPSTLIRVIITLGEALAVIFAALGFETVTALVQFRGFLVHIAREGDGLILLRLHLTVLLRLRVISPLKGLHEISLHLLFTLLVGLFLVLW